MPSRSARSPDLFDSHHPSPLIWIQLTASSTPTTRYSYGWHRAEILAALVNGVFLLALCLTITLEALERFFSTPGASSLLFSVFLVLMGPRDFQSQARSSRRVTRTNIEYPWPLSVPRSALRCG